MPIDPTQPLPMADDCLPDSIAKPWREYRDAWAAHHANPGNATVRKALGIEGADESVSPSSGDAAARSMRLPASEWLLYTSKHFSLVTDVPEARAAAIIINLERFYAVWTQLFFPLWKDRRAGNLPPTNVRHRVVIISDANQFRELVRGELAGTKAEGIYSDLKRTSYFLDSDDDAASMWHEITHQLLNEATTDRSRTRAGERQDFWMVEGIACYMESMTIVGDHATVGGWQSSRLQYARHQLLGTGTDMPLATMRRDGRIAVQRRDDLVRWYTVAAANVHQMADHENGAGWLGVLKQLATIYQGNRSELARCNHPPSVSLASYLDIDDSQLQAVAPGSMASLCLTRTRVTSDGLAKIAPQSKLRWLDVSFLTIETDDVTQLCPLPDHLEQLSLEATGIDAGIAPWIATAKRLREVDLSSTRIDDSVIASIDADAPMETLWLTGATITDASIDTIAAMRTLKYVDVQRTGVSAAGVARLCKQRPDLVVNPLEIAP